jgi:hypothetical protein
LKQLIFLLPGLFACGGSDPSGSGSVEPTATETSALEAPIHLGVPWLPPGDGLVLWLRSDVGVTLASDGTVANWHDLTGLGGRDAAPIFGFPGPLYVPDAFHGHPALHGDGTARTLFVNAGHGYPMGHASTVFLVMSAATKDAGTAGFAFDTESSQGRQYSVVQVPDGSIEWANATTASAVSGAGSLALPGGGLGDLFKFTEGLPSAGLHVFAETQTDGVSAHGYFDFCEVASFVPTGPSLYLMSLMSGPGNGFMTGNNDPGGFIISAGSFDTDGDLVEVLQYDRERSAIQIAEVEAYLAVRYGIR